MLVTIYRGEREYTDSIRHILHDRECSTRFVAFNYILLQQETSNCKNVQHIPENQKHA